MSAISSACYPKLLAVIIPCSSSLFHPNLKLKHINPPRRSSRWSASAVESEESQVEINQNDAREALKKLDLQLESLSQQDTVPRRRPPPSVPEPKMDREWITRMRPEEMPEISASFLTYSAFALVLLTIINNIIFNVYIKPSIDGYEEVSRIQRVPLLDPTEQQSPQLAGQQ